MFPVPLYIELVALLVGAVVGFAIGASAGWLISRGLKLPAEGLVKDGLLGALGFVIGFVGCIIFPFVTGAKEMLPYPQWVALAGGVGLPGLREWLRARKSSA